MTTRVQRVEPEFLSTGGPVVLWRDVSAALERLVFGEQRLASPTDRLCAVHLCGGDAAHSEVFRALGVITQGVEAGPAWERYLPELLRGLDALDDTDRVFSGLRTEALRQLQSAMRARLLAAGARDRGAGTSTLVARVAQLLEEELRVILQARGAVVFADPFGLSPVEWAIVERARALWPGVQVELPLPDLPLDAERARDPLEASAAWAELRVGDALNLVLLPRAWGRERGRLASDEASSLIAWSVRSVYDQAECVVRDMVTRLSEGAACDSIMVVCEDATRRRELLQCMQSACIPALCRSEGGSAFESYYRGLVSLFKHVQAPFPSPVWEGLATLLLQGPLTGHSRAGAWLAAQRVYVPRVWQLAAEEAAPDEMRALARALEQMSSAGSWSALFEAARAVTASLGTELAWGAALAATLASADADSAAPAAPLLGATAPSAQGDVAARAHALRFALAALSELERSLHRLDAMQSAPSAELVAVALASAEKNGAPASRAAGAAAVRVLSSIAEAPVGARIVYLLDMTHEAFPARGSDAPLGLDEQESSMRDRHAQQRWTAYANLARITESAECTFALVPRTGEGREVLEPAAGLYPRPVSAAHVLEDAPDDVRLRAAREDARRRISGDADVLGRVQAIAHRVQLADATGLRKPMPITRLERFVLCPFQGYVASALGAREADRKPWMADARELGSTRHEALHVVFDAVRSELEGMPTDAARVLAKARIAFAQWAGDLLASGRGLVDAVDRDAVWAMVLRALRMAMAEPEYVYNRGELGFGGTSDERAAMVLPLASGPLRLMGRIDRVDVLRADKTRLRVVDYKSGTTKPALREVGTRMLQAPLYALSLAHSEAGHSSRAGTSNAWAYVYPRGGEQLDSQSISKDESQTGERQDRIALSVATATTSVERVRAGDVSPLPLDGACAQCDARGVCRYDAAQAGADEETEA